MTKQQIWAVMREQYPSAELLKLADVARFMNLSETSARKAIDHLPYVMIGQTKMWWIKNIVEYLYSQQEEGHDTPNE